MTTSGAHMAKLVQLAHEPSSEQRRALLREITDLFFEDESMRAGEAGDHTDAILSQIAVEMEENVRAELAERFADSADAPGTLVRQLANDAAEIARPILERSAALSDDDLIAIADAKGQAHLQAIARRNSVSENVSDALVRRGDDQTLVALASNEGAKLSRGAMETMVDRAENSEALHAPLVDREELPPDLLNEMYFYVGEKLREKIAERNENFDPAELDAVVEAARARASRYAPQDKARYDDAVKFVESKKLRRQLNGELLLELAQDRRRARFEVAFAEMTGLDYTAARRIAANPAVDPLAIACRAAGFETDLFVKLALFRKLNGARPTSDSDALSEIYESLPEDAAKRAVRFWRMRKDAEAPAPA